MKLEITMTSDTHTATVTLVHDSGQALFALEELGALLKAEEPGFYTYKAFCIEVAALAPEDLGR